MPKCISQNNVLEPQLNNLRQELKGRKLNAGLALLKAAAYCTPASLFGLSQLGAVRAAIGATMGAFPVVVEAVKQCFERESALRNNPLSYVLRLQGKDGMPRRHDLRLGFNRPK